MSPSEKMFMRLLGARVRARREQRGLTLQALSLATGVNVGNVTLIERGIQAISLLHVYRIARVLECDPAELLPTQAEVCAALSKAAGRL